MEKFLDERRADASRRSARACASASCRAISCRCSAAPRTTTIGVQGSARRGGGRAALAARRAPAESGAGRRATTRSTCQPDAAEPLAAVVFKTLSEQHLGELSLIRVYSGHVEPGHGAAEHVARPQPRSSATLYHLVGKERRSARARRPATSWPRSSSGDAHRRHAVPTRRARCSCAPPDFPSPVTAECIRAKNKGDEEKMAQGLARLHEEDPTFSRHFEAEHARDAGPRHGRPPARGHGRPAEEALRRRGRADAPARAVPRDHQAARPQGEYRHKKQTGGRGQFGEVHLRLEPLHARRGLRVPRRGQGRRGAEPVHPRGREGRGRRRWSAAPLAGYPVVDVAGRAVLRQVPRRRLVGNGVQDRGRAASTRSCSKAEPVLLEPIDEIEVRVPEEFLGDVMGDLSSRRGKILGTETDGHYQVDQGAWCRMAELYKYATHLRSMTQGRGTHAREFSHYEEVPRELADKVIAAAQGREGGRERTPERAPPRAPCPAIPSGRRSSARRPRPTPARGKMFSKYIKEITIAARHGGGDPDGNPRLRTAIAGRQGREHAGRNIERAIKRGTGELEGATLRGDRTTRATARRRGAAGRGRDRQPQPHRRRRPPHLHQVRRQPGRGRQRRRTCSSRAGVIVVDEDARSPRTR